MEKVKKMLEAQRVSFTRIYDAVITLLGEKNINLIEIRGNVRILDQKIELIADLGRQLLDHILESESSEESALLSEIEAADNFLKKYHELKLIIESHSPNHSDETSNVCSTHTKRKLKLPTIEFKKFGGDIRDWLPFWSQFKRIHNDEDLPVEDKFQYLLQAMIPNSRARQLVESYPPSGDNYPKVIESLESRFGRKDLLVEVYVRELLKLVLTSIGNRNKLSFLYDKLESQLRSLETLDVTSDTCAAMLYPLVESCLPEDLIRVWQRSSHYDVESTLKIRLDNLMIFLRKEVENEERITLAVAGFDMQSKTKKIVECPPVKNALPTASGLMNNKFQKKCHFCNGSHCSGDCSDARNWTLADRKKKLIERGCCYLCLKYGHIARKCRVNSVCSICNGRHVDIMCTKTDETTTKFVPAPKQSNVENSLSNNTYAEVFLQTLRVRLNGLNKSRMARVIIDTGSQRSYIKQSVASEMLYESIRREEMVHALFGGTNTDVCNHHCYRIRLSSIHDDYACNFEALDQTVICNNVTSVRQGPWMDELSSLGIEISDEKDGPVDILIGADIAGKLLTGKRHELKCGLVALHTLLGWTIMGKVTSNEQSINSSMLVVTSMLSRDLGPTDLWSLDVLGITDPLQQKSEKDTEKAVMEHFLETVLRKEDGRYEVHMPWIEGHPPLPNNFSIAQRRLENLMKKLNNDGYLQEYSQVFKEWLDEGIIEEVPVSDLQYQGHYLPHRHVVRESSTTTKIRPVFDASAKEKNQPSLNQCLEKGINLIELIPSILIKFRLGKIGVIADIKKAFLQISLTSTDRDFLRFLWYNENGELKTYRHTRVVFGVTCSPFLLGAVIEYHLKICFETKKNSSIKSIIPKLLKSFYVDNCVSSVDSKEELQMFIDESSMIFADAKFELRGWEHTVIDNSEVASVLSPVLGLNWNRNLDTLELNSEWYRDINIELITKRIILSTAQRIFDPIGFSCPVSLYPKILLQKTWNLKLGWDTEVPDDIKICFLSWIKDIPFLLDLKIPRWLVTSDAVHERWTLHVFCDASGNSYATAIFLRSESSRGVEVQLIQAKSRVAPIKQMTIPRLELLAATIGARLSKMVSENLPVDIPVYWWSDSSTVLAWIKRDDNWKPFIWNRVKEIRNLTNKEAWFHVPGHFNPADLPSRGCSPKQLVESRWWEGPEWLKKSPEQWPSQNYSVEEDVINTEKRKCVTSSMLSSNQCFSWFYERFSGFEKIVRILSWIRRFIFNSLNRNEKKIGPLSLAELISSENCIIKFIQEEAFEGLNDPKLKTLCPFIDNDGIIRLSTKISAREDSRDFRFPAVLPSKHPVVDKIAHEQHVKASHVGVQGLLSLLRERFWILKGRKTLRSIVTKCVVCRRYNGKSSEVSPIPLPRDRVRDANVFEVAGVDLAGPLYIRSGEKVWICLFTCAVYRAVHLELLSSLSTDIFLQSFRRFVARRGRPSIIYSDNGTNFVGTDNAFRHLDWNEIITYSSAQRIEWKFNPPTAAWWGGWWERLIRIVKDLLRKVLGKSSLTYEELYTIVCDTESVVNSRPLTYFHEDSRDLVPLTPAMFLREIQEVGVPDVDATEATDLRKHLKYRLKLKEDLRRRFRTEYLGELKLFSKGNNVKEIKLGDIVLVGLDNIKRLDWPLARIEEMIPGRDGKIRVVRLKTATGSLLRPVQRIYPLEINSRDNEIDFHALNKIGQEKMKEEKGTKRDREPEEQKNEKDDKPAHEKKPVVTRYGRIVKPPSKYTG
ncbi:uncharacterized protein LOC123686673 [Harmonia axyridis]|uniref:uncharacterized protein LOC123686673 n=1 Tax=Harmonia axyridis TaxID=115357 RepID=UPI001E275676|nr:uncharacterized protein LOC123686673 [Harmonia axyridis]